MRVKGTRELYFCLRCHRFQWYCDCCFPAYELDDITNRLEIEYLNSLEGTIWEKKSLWEIPVRVVKSKVKQTISRTYPHIPVSFTKFCRHCEVDFYW